MFDFRRCRAAVATVLSLAVALALLNAALGATIGSPARWFPRDEDTYDWLFLERAASQFAAAKPEAARRVGKIGVVIGLSTAAQAINSDVLTEKGPPGYRWIVTNGFGGTMHKPAEFARLMAASGLRPASVIVALNPIMLAAHPSPGPPEGDARRPATLREAIKDHFWIVSSRYHVKHVVRRSILFFKTALIARLGGDPGAAVAPAASAWEQIDLDLSARMTPEQARSQAEQFRSINLFAPESYAVDSAASAELIATVRAARATGARVVVVVLPESTLMRQETPPGARGLTRQVLEHALGAEAPPVLDLNDVLNDDEFLNLTHANQWGRDRFTPLLARRLRDLLH